MNRRAWLIALSAVLALAAGFLLSLLIRSTNAWEANCKQAGGHVDSRIVSWYPVTIGKSVVMQPVYETRCLAMDGTEIR